MPDFKPILFNTEMVKAVLEGRKTQTRRIAFLSDDLREFRNDDYPEGWWYKGRVFKSFDGFLRYQQSPRCKYKPGDILWVRETWCDPYPENPLVPFAYKADFPRRWDVDQTEHGDPIIIAAEEMKWKPSIHMPREAPRIFLLVKDVRMERLQDVGCFDSLNEGIAHLYDNLSDAEYENWASRSGYHGKKKSEWPYINYLWHGHFGSCGTGNRISDAWPYQFSSYKDPRGSFSSLWNSTVDLKDWDKHGWDANPWVWVIKFERVENPANWVLEVDKS